MTSNPIDIVLVDDVDVSKSSFRAFSRERLPVRVGSLTEFRATSFSGQYGCVYNTASNALYAIDTADTTSADDGLAVIIDADGNRFKIVSWYLESGIFKTTKGIAPSANDGAAIGTSALGISDLFFAAGAVINWNNGALTITETSGSVTVSSATAGAAYTLSNTDAGAVGVSLDLYHDSTTPAANDVISRIRLYGRDSAANKQQYGEWSCTIDDATSTTEDATIRWAVVTAGTLADRLKLGGTVLGPVTNDDLSLGSATVGFSDAFFASGAVINFNNSNVTITHSAALLTIAGGGIVLAAGTTSLVPLKMQSGSKLTTAEAGAVEYDGNSFFLSPAASHRGAVVVEHFIRQHATYTLTSQTPAQKLFNGSANGAVTLPLGVYQFECMFALSSMSGTSGNAAFSIVDGTGVSANAQLFWTAIDAGDTGSGGAAFQSGMVASLTAPTNMATAATATTMRAMVRGTFEVTTAGTFTPSIALQTAAAAVVAIGSFFRVWRVGDATDVTRGNWS